MDLGKLKGGQLIAAVGGIVLLISLLFLNWYGVGGSVQTSFGSISVGADFGAWDGQGFSGTIANLIILAAGIAAVGMAVLTATSRTVALPVAASAMTAGLGIGAVVMVVLRILFQPGPNGLVDLKFGIFLALAGALGVAYGGWQSMQEEGTSFDHARDQLQGRFGDDRADTSAARSPEPAPPPPTAPPTAPPTSAPPRDVGPTQPEPPIGDGEGAPPSPGV
jgi:hypothetical protein